MSQNIGGGYMHVSHEHVKLSLTVQYWLYLNYVSVGSDVDF